LEFLAPLINLVAINPISGPVQDSREFIVGWQTQSLAYPSKIRPLLQIPAQSLPSDEDISFLQTLKVKFGFPLKLGWQKGTTFKFTPTLDFQS
ncbi:MAG: hypothetical protein DMG65_23815, partial [Candidatus Angelobacter sp. Gp1-AA117]